MNEFKKGDIVIITDETLALQRGTRIGVITDKELLHPIYHVKLCSGTIVLINVVNLKPIDYSNIVVMVDNEEEYNDIAQILGMRALYDNDCLIYPDTKKKGHTSKSKIEHTNTSASHDCIDYSEFMYFLKGYYAPEKETYILSDSLIAIQKHASILIESERVYINSLINLKSILQKEIDNIDNKLKELNNGKA